MDVKEKKKDIIRFRVSHNQLLRAKAMSESKGYPNLSAFLRHLIFDMQVKEDKLSEIHFYIKKINEKLK